MDKIIFQRLKIEAPLFWKLFLGLGFFILVGYLCAHYMETEGHYVTGMNNQIAVSYTHLRAHET